MKIVMFTPAVQVSAIGRMACLLTAALQAAGHTISIVRAETEQLLHETTHDFGAELVAWTELARVRELLAAADLVVHQVGDNHQFHQGCLEWLNEAPGIICLHDYFVGHLFCGWAQHRREEACTILEKWYGSDAAASFFQHPDSESFIEGTHRSAPMTEWICAMGSAVITHSSWGIARVLDACPGPVRVVALPYSAPAAPVRHAASRDGMLRVLTVGHVNPNKRVASVIRAIGGSETLRAVTVYRLVGAIAPAVVVALSTLARNSQVNLLISDQVEAPTLISALDEADVVVCLRLPSLEAASASAIEALLYGKPVIVTDTNFYSEIPDDCVVKINPEDEVGALQRALAQLHADPVLRATLGERGQRWAQATFSADKYAAQLVAVGADAAHARPVQQAMNALARTLGSWGGSSDMLGGAHTLLPLALFNNSNPD